MFYNQHDCHIALTRTLWANITTVISFELEQLLPKTNKEITTSYRYLERSFLVMNDKHASKVTFSSNPYWERKISHFRHDRKLADEHCHMSECNYTFGGCDSKLAIPPGYAVTATGAGNANNVNLICPGMLRVTFDLRFSAHWPNFTPGLLRTPVENIVFS